MIKFKCIICNRIFSVNYKVNKGFEPKYCSKKCRYIKSKDKRVFTCSYCGKEFTPNYNVSRQRVLNYCSKSCSGYAKSLGMNRYFSKSILKRDIIKFIIKNNEYTTYDKIKEHLHVSNRTINKFGISIIECNKKAGFKKSNSFMEKLVEHHLITILGFDVVREKSFDGLVGLGGGNLRFDFYIKQLNLLIELDDLSHYDSTHRNYSIKQVKHDKLKTDFAINNKFKFIRVKYVSVRKDYEMILKEIESYINSLNI